MITKLTQTQSDNSVMQFETLWWPLIQCAIWFKIKNNQIWRFAKIITVFYMVKKGII